MASCDHYSFSAFMCTPWLHAVTLHLGFMRSLFTFTQVYTYSMQMMFVYTLQGSLPIYSSKVAVSVVDNVLLVHQVDAKVVILYDIFADSRAPISAPLPLLFRGFPRSNSSSLRPNREDTESSEVNVMSDHEAIVYGDDWSFLVPDLICDVVNQLLWKIHLDLEASLFIFICIIC